MYCTHIHIFVYYIEYDMYCIYLNDNPFCLLPYSLFKLSVHTPVREQSMCHTMQPHSAILVFAPFKQTVFLAGSHSQGQNDDLKRWG